MWLKSHFHLHLFYYPVQKAKWHCLNVPEDFPGRLHPASLTVMLALGSEGLAWRGQVASYCLVVLTLPPLSCLLPAVVIFLIRIMAFQIISILSWNCKPSLIVDSFLFEWEQPWSLHILMKNLIWKEFALKLLDLENCFLMENDPIFLFHRIMVISPILRDK